MKDEFIIINKTAIQKRIEELQKYVGSRRPSADEYAKMHIYREILSQSTPLIPVLEDCYENGMGSGKYQQEYGNNAKGSLSKEQYISNLKLDI